MREGRKEERKKGRKEERKKGRKGGRKEGRKEGGKKETREKESERSFLQKKLLLRYLSTQSQGKKLTNQTTKTTSWNTFKETQIKNKLLYVTLKLCSSSTLATLESPKRGK